MCEWQRQIQKLIEEIDLSIKQQDSKSLSLSCLAEQSGYSEFYGVTPGTYRKCPKPVALRTVIKPFDCYLCETGGKLMKTSTQEIKTYFVTIPAHKFLHIENYESIGYWDFWQKQSLIPGQDCETICGLLDSIKGKLDDMDHGLSQRTRRQDMQLGHSPRGMLRRTPADGL